MHKKEHEHYIRQLEYEQFHRCLSNKQMADLLGLPLSSYKNLIYGRTNTIELDLILDVYEVNGKMMYEMTGVRPPKELLMSQLYKELDKESQRLVDDFIILLIQKRKRE